jgi:hypothetical protein
MENKGASELRRLRHGRLRTLALQWIRKHKPNVYRNLSKRAADDYPKVSVVNSNHNER